jgi:alpha-tubulin suppressor-like RCC1 family protein
VTATSSTPLSYQWQFNATNIVGATNASLTLLNISGADGGIYDVIVSNAYGAIVSSNAVLSIGLSLIISWGDNNYGEANVPPSLTNVVSVAAGGGFNMALKADGTVMAWGNNGAGQTNIPPGLSNVVAISAGYSHGLALRNNGTVIAWGDSFATNMASGLSNIIAISAGSSRSLVLKSDGTVIAWGYNNYGQTNVPAGLSNLTAIAAGRYQSFDNYAVGIQNSGNVVAWGYDYSGQTDVPAGLSNVTAVAAGTYHALALRTDGTIVSWGSAFFSALPLGVTNVAAIATGSYHSLALKNDGTVAAWGSNNSGQTNVPPGLKNVVAVSGGDSHSMALLRGGVPVIANPPVSFTAISGTPATFIGGAIGSFPLSYQWQFNGTNIIGATNVSLTINNVQLGNAGAYRVVVSNAYGSVSSPSGVLTVANPANIAPAITSQPTSQTLPFGQNTTFLVTAVGSPTLNYQWQLNGTNIAAATNASLLLTGLSSNNVGSYRVMVSNAFGTTISSNAFFNPVASLIVAWGYNAYGQTNVPPGLSNVMAIAGGGEHSLALKSDGTVVAWGYNGAGQANVPPGLSNVVAIAAGDSHSMALKSDGTVVAWGSNTYGQTNVPTGLNNVAFISAGTYHSVAAKNDGTVVAWGDDSFREVEVPSGLSGIVSIAAGVYDSIASKNDGIMVGWGTNYYGQLSIPIGFSNVIAVAAGQFHSLALSSEGTTMAWGDDYYGESDRPFGQGSFVAIAANNTHNIALTTNGTVVAWGDDSTGESDVPTGLTNAMAVAAGAYHSLALIRNGSPVISASPFSYSIRSGSPASFHVAATGSSPLKYQWQFNGTNVVGATNASITLNNVQAVNAGSYRAVVNNAVGSMTSKVAILTVITPPPNDNFGQRIPIPGLSVIVMGSNVGATKQSGEPNHAGNAGSSSVWYSWGAPANGLVTIDTAGSVFNTLLAVYTGNNVSNLTLIASNDDFGGFFSSQVTFNATLFNSYAIAVDGYNGSSGNFALHVNETPSVPIIMTAPQNQTAIAGASTSFNVKAIGTAPLHYQWQCNGTSIPGANASILLLTNLQLTNAGNYSVTVSNANGLVSASALLTVAMSLGAIRSSNQLLLNWSGPYILQTSTNVVGPYIDILGSTNSFTNLIGTEPKRFFRLRSTAINAMYPTGILANGQFLFGGSGVPGYNYVVQASTNLADWMPLQTNTTPFQFADTNAFNYPRRFYRTFLIH